MDDQQTYLLNGLLGRSFGLGRVLRFRKVARGRQAETFEVLTQEQHEYTIFLYPPSYAAGHLNFTAEAINLLDEHRFSVVPMLRVKEGEGGFTAEGPQGASMLVSLTTTGSALPAEQHTEHDLSQAGLRLAWLHRLLKEHVPAPVVNESLLKRVHEQLECRDGESLRRLPNFPPEGRKNLMELLTLPAAQGWVHGDIQPAAFLMDADHQLRTMVDFGLLHWGSPAEDLIDAVLNFCLDGAGGISAGRTRALLEAYDSLSPLKKVPWTPVVGSWLGRRLLDAGSGRRGLPTSFSRFLAAPENLATALASCV